MNTTNHAFWKDEPELQSAKLPNSFMPFFKIYSAFLLVFFAAIPVYFLGLISKYLGLAWLGLMILLYVFAIYQKRYRKKAASNVDEIQNNAKETIGAIQIGSAIHVAGHPLLQREQLIVLALVEDQLNIYGFETSTPFDTIYLKSIQEIHTVVYDDERVPHIDVIDSAAQALQITFSWHEQLCTCLFRCMRKVRPIDWYHVIQQKRLQFGLVK
jgi:hypothetical protein